MDFPRLPENYPYDNDYDLSEWADNLHLYSEEKRRLLDSGAEFNDEVHQQLIQKYRI
jgi:hypothetical protein